MVIDIDRGESSCSCNLSTCRVSCCKYSGMNPFKPKEVSMLELMDKIDEQVEIYKQMPKGKERNAYRHLISELVTECNKRGLILNKIAPFKTLWWL